MSYKYALYKYALETAGATVHAFQNFGSYQGDWWAKVTYNGVTGWINGSYGSCSGCDAFAAEFDDDGHYDCTTGARYTYIGDDAGFADDCPKCQDAKTRLIAFGKQYLDDMMTQEQAELAASRNLEWDMDAQEMLDFIRENALDAAGVGDEN